MELILIHQQTPRHRAAPIPALTGSHAPVLAMYRDVQVVALAHPCASRHSDSCPSSRETGSRERPVHSSGSYGYIASRGGRGAPPRSGGDLTPGGAKTRGGIRSDIPPTGGRIPGYAGAPALRLERVFRSRAASGHTSPRQLLHALLSALAWPRPVSRSLCDLTFSCFALPSPSMDSYLLHGPGQPLDHYAVSPSPGSR